MSDLERLWQIILNRSIDGVELFIKVLDGDANLFEVRFGGGDLAVTGGEALGSTGKNITGFGALYYLPANGASAVNVGADFLAQILPRLLVEGPRLEDVIRHLI